MKPSLFARLLSICLICAVLAGCTPPKISPEFQKQLTTLIEKGDALASLPKSGIGYVDFTRKLAEVKAAYLVAASSWPDDFSPDARFYIDNTFYGWDLANYLWQLKLGDHDNPIEPDVNRYQEYIDYTGGALVIDTFPADFIVPAYRGKKYLPFDENIGVLLGLAGKNFDIARNMLLAEMR